MNKKVSFRLPEKNLEDIDELIQKGQFKDRSAFFNAAVVQLLGDEKRIQSLREIHKK